MGELLELHGHVGKTKTEHCEQLQQVEQVIQSINREVSAVCSTEAKSLEGCQAKLLQIQVTFTLYCQ